jgi:hypothetical protein
MADNERLAIGHQPFAHHIFRNMTSDRPVRPQKGEWNDGEFESFLAEIAPALEQSVGRLGVAGSLDTRASFVDPEKLIHAWPEISDRIIEELR